MSRGIPCGVARTGHRSRSVCDGHEGRAWRRRVGSPAAACQAGRARFASLQSHGARLPQHADGAQRSSRCETWNAVTGDRTRPRPAAPDYGTSRLTPTSAVPFATASEHHSYALSTSFRTPRPHVYLPQRSPGAHVAGVSPVPVQMCEGQAQSRCRCPRGEHSPGADVGGASHRGHRRCVRVLLSLLSCRCCYCCCCTPCVCACVRACVCLCRASWRDCERPRSRIALQSPCFAIIRYSFAACACTSSDPSHTCRMASYSRRANPASAHTNHRCTQRSPVRAPSPRPPSSARTRHPAAA
jgi:hypothetical protein